MEACLDASATDDSATCADVIGKFLETTGQTKHDGVRGKIQEASLKMEFQKEAHTAALEVCLDAHEADSAAFDTCMTEQANAAFEDMAFPNASTKAAKKMQAMREAKTGYAGEELKNCKETAQGAGDAAAIEAAVQACYTAMNATIQALGIE